MCVLAGLKFRRFLTFLAQLALTFLFPLDYGLFLFVLLFDCFRLVNIGTRRIASSLVRRNRIYTSLGRVIPLTKLVTVVFEDTLSDMSLQNLLASPQSKFDRPISGAFVPVQLIPSAWVHYDFINICDFCGFALVENWD